MLPKKRKGLLNYINNLTIADRLAYASVISAIIFSSWGITLTYKVINTSVVVSHFDSLLSKTDSVIDQQSNMLARQDSILTREDSLVTNSKNETKSLIDINKRLSAQLDVLSQQYSLSITQQKLSNLNESYRNSSNQTKFYVATQNLHLLTWQPWLHPSKLNEWDLNLKIDFLNKANEILSSQLDNPFLLSNKLMLSDWINARDSIVWYIGDLNFYPQKPEDSLRWGGETYQEVQDHLTERWRNCYLTIANVEQCTYGYMLYYSFRDSKIPKPNLETYKQIRKLRWQTWKK